MPTYSLTLEYDGTDFAGWQIQPSVRTAMGVFGSALHAVTSESPALTAAGRTDSGAHAHGQVVGCTLERDWAPDELRNALNATLPADLAVRNVAIRNRRLPRASRRGGADVSLSRGVQRWQVAGDAP